MNEDAGCNNPCGGEPMQCSACPEIRSSETPPDEFEAYDYWDNNEPDECPECGDYLDGSKCPECGWTVTL